MPEYLSPGVYIEETSFRSKTIEGVSTSTAGFVGPCRSGPVSGQPELVTSLADFQRIYGDLEDLVFTNQANPTVNYLAHGVRAFFEEGGRRLFVQRVFNAPRLVGFDIDEGIPAHHYATANTLTDSLAPELLDAAENALVNALSGPEQAIGSAMDLAQMALAAAQASHAATVSEGAAAQVQTDADAAVTAATTAQTEINNANAAIAALVGGVNADTDATAAQTAIDTAVTEATNARTAAETAATSIATEGNAQLDGLAEDAVAAAGALAATVAALQVEFPPVVTMARAVTVLADLNDAGTDITAGDVTALETELNAARTALTAALTDLTAAQAAFDAAPDNPANVTALVEATNAFELAGEAVETAETAWLFATTAQQIETIQPGAGEQPLHLVARFPGAAGNMRVTFTLRAFNNVYQARPTMPNPGLNRLRSGALVHLRTRATATDPWQLRNNTDPDGLMLATYDQAADLWTMNGVDATGATTTVTLDGTFRTNLGTDQFEVRPVNVVVSVERPTAQPNQFEGEETLGEYNFEPQRRESLLNTFTANPQNRFDALTIPVAIVMPSEVAEPTALDIARHLLAAGGLMRLLSRNTVEFRYTLANGDDGEMPTGPTYGGDPDFEDLTGDVLQMPLNGLLAFEGEQEISIVAAPGYAADRGTDDALGIQNAVINHCERMRYRVAVLETPEDQTVGEALDFRNLRSSDYAALYYPWITVIDPRPDQGGRRLNLPPSGFLAGIYARNDSDHAVFKAPANEVVRLAIDFELRLNQAQQDVLNPNGVNCLRFFEGRGFLVWGARTISDDPEWKYISVRRYFAYMERSIDNSTQWAVFENNGPELWGKIRRSVEDFLYNEWKSGGLLGDKPEQAYFVRCDRSTMTQNDLDNGRLICLIGVAVVKPAEFVIFRIGQWTADADR